jgi:hypothetical protein
MADRVSRGLREEADVRRNHELFNGRNAVRTPLSTPGHYAQLETMSSYLGIRNTGRC